MRARTLLLDSNEDPFLDTLSPRQREVVALLMRGASQKAAALALGISLQTLKNHLTAIYQRTDTHSVAGLTRWFLLRALTWELRRLPYRVVVEERGQARRPYLRRDAVLAVLRRTLCPPAGDDSREE